MARSALTRPAARTQLQTGTLVDQDPQTQSRLLSELADAHEDVAARVIPRETQTVDLVVGSNQLNHGLNRRARGCTVTPTVANATFAWAMTAATDKQVTIVTVGVDQPGATVEVF